MRFRGSIRAAPGFTLLELLIVVAILAVLATLAGSGVVRAMSVMDETECAHNLRQLGMALQGYLRHREGEYFAFRESASGGTQWYFGLETRGSAGLGEGNRELDRSKGPLAPYLGGTAEAAVCPSVPFGGSYKPKFAGDGWTYGINRYLCSHHSRGNHGWIAPGDAERTVVFADAAQVNTFQAPASMSHPMVEDWYYVEPRMPCIQFRHNGRANVLFADWHVGAVGPDPDRFDRRMPEAMIGQFEEGRVLFEPARRP